ncbi:NAD(P)-binding domain-containing protein [Candidatus Woesearchaeota archaeon]|nr:NAD(P)-binding domain-containing protein [Candidatus Woesearchaeota archaeon]
MIAFLVQDNMIGIIGAGHLGTAVIAALHSRNHQQIIASRRDAAQIQQVAEQYGILGTTSNVYAAEKADIVVVAVKPYMIEQVGEEIKDAVHNKLVVSLAAAKGISYLEKIMPQARVARVMTGIFVEDEIAAYALGSRSDGKDAGVIKYIFRAAVQVHEDALADRTWIACDAGLMAKGIQSKIGALPNLQKEDARQMYAATLEGIAKSLKAGLTGDEIFDLVAGPGSFTGKLEQSLHDAGYYKTLKECVERTVTACKG